LCASRPQSWCAPACGRWQRRAESVAVAGCVLLVLFYGPAAVFHSQTLVILAGRLVRLTGLIISGVNLCSTACFSDTVAIRVLHLLQYLCERSNAHVQAAEPWTCSRRLCCCSHCTEWASEHRWVTRALNDDALIIIDWLTEQCRPLRCLTMRPCQGWQRR
jgi:hypothetical protein